MASGPGHGRASGYIERVTRDDRTIVAARWSDSLGNVATRCAQLLLCAAAAALVLWGLVTLRLVVVPAILATMVAAASWPLVSWLRARNVPNAIAAALTLLVGGGVLVLLGWVVVRGVYGEWDELRDGATAGLEELRRLATSVLPINGEQFREARRALIDSIASEQSQAEAATRGAIKAVELVASTLLFLVVLFFLLKDGPRLYRFALNRLPRDQHERARRVGERSLDVLGSFVRGTAFVAAIDAFFIGIALVLLGVPLALPLAVVVFIGAFVPIAGATIAGALAALIALVTNGPVVALIVVGVVLAVNQLEGDIIAPIVLGNAVALHPLAVLLALASGAIVAGIIGALLAVPVVAVAWAMVTAWDDPESESKAAG